jgi:hypothetical protein
VYDDSDDAVIMVAALDDDAGVAGTVPWLEVDDTVSLDLLKAPIKVADAPESTCGRRLQICHDIVALNGK